MIRFTIVIVPVRKSKSIGRYLLKHKHVHTHKKEYKNLNIKQNKKKKKKKKLFFHESRDVTGKRAGGGGGKRRRQSIKRTVHLVIFFLYSPLLSSSSQSVGPCYRVRRHTSVHDVPRGSTALAGETRRGVVQCSLLYRSDASRTQWVLRLLLGRRHHVLIFVHHGPKIKKREKERERKKRANKTLSTEQI
jgi:hypothetical protein